MKEKIQTILQKIPSKNKSLILTLVILSIFITTLIFYEFTVEDRQVSALEQATGVQESIASRIAVVGAESVIATGNVGPSNSWPGEIVSSEIAQIQPQREGVITEWRVRVGQQVYAGQILGKISAPPATPELIQMLAEQTEAVTRARAQADIVDKYTTKEQARLIALRDSIGSTTSSTTDLTFTALQSLRDKAEVKRQALRSFVERALSNHVAIVTNFSDWRYVRYGGLAGYGINQNIKNEYEMSLVNLVEALKNTRDVPTEIFATYFNWAVRFANILQNDAETGFKVTATSDQKDFLEFVSEYKDVEAEVADKETEYKIMISEKTSMLERERSIAHIEAQVAETAYKTVSNQISGGVNIYAPRSGSISAIYKKVGELVGPEMSLAVIIGNSNDGFLVRMRIPSNVQKPIIGDIVSVVRPGFPRDMYKAKILGVGKSLDETGSYMADASMIDRVDWPAEASVRVIASNNSNTPTIPLSSVLWDEAGIPYVWGVSDKDRIVAKKIRLGRTLGISIEVYEGLKKGDRYILRPDTDIHEGMLLKDGQSNIPEKAKTPIPTGHEGHGSM